MHHDEDVAVIPVLIQAIVTQRSTCSNIRDSRSGRLRPAWCRARSPQADKVPSPLVWSPCNGDTDELGDVLVHANPTAVFQLQLEGSHGTTMAVIFHVSTHHQPHLKLLSAAGALKHRTPINLEPKELLVIQGDLTIVRHKRRSPRSDRAQIGTRRLLCVLDRLLRRKSFILLAGGIHRGRTNTHGLNSYSPQEKSTLQLRSPAMCMIV